MYDNIEVMNLTLGHFKAETNARPIYNELNEQIGWIFPLEQTINGTPTNLVMSIAWEKYLQSPYCSHSASNFSNLTAHQKILHNPVYEKDSLPFQHTHKAFHFNNSEKWNENNLYNTNNELEEEEFKISSPSNYGLVGFYYIDNAITSQNELTKIEVYFEDTMFNTLVNKDLTPNEAYWKKGGYTWVNLTIPFSEYSCITQYQEPSAVIYHAPILSWDEPDISFSPYLGLFNWLYLDEP